MGLVNEALEMEGEGTVLEGKLITLPIDKEGAACVNSEGGRRCPYRAACAEQLAYYVGCDFSAGRL